MRIPFIGLSGFLAIAIGVAFLGGFAEHAVAQIAPSGDNAVDEILNPIRATFAAQRGVVMDAIRNLFYFLALLEFVYSFSMTALGNNGNLGTFAKMLVERAVVLMLFYWFVDNGWWVARLITDTAMTVGNNITGINAFNPSDIFDKGLKLAGDWFASSSGYFVNPVAAAGTAFSAIAVLLLYVAIAGELVVVLAETYVLLLAGIFLLAFGGASWTRSYAVAYFVWTLGAALKIIVMYVIIAMGFTVVDAWSVANITGTFSVSQAITLIGTLSIIWVMQRRVPSAAADMLRGFYTSGRSSMFDTVTQPAQTMGMSVTPGAALNAIKNPDLVAKTAGTGLILAAGGVYANYQNAQLAQQSINYVAGGLGAGSASTPGSIIPGPAQSHGASPHSLNDAATQPMSNPSSVTGPRR